MSKKTITLSLLMLSLAVQAQWKDGGTKITTTQNVGIGTDNPSYKLDVVGNTRLQNIILMNGYQITRNVSDNFTYQNNSIGHYSISWNSDSWQTGSGTLWQSGYGGIKFFTSGTYRMGINSKGDVGIGTDNPTQKLDIAGNIRTQNLVLPTGYRVTVTLKENFSYQNRNFGHYAFGWNADSWNTSGPTLWQSGYGGIKFFTSGTYRMGINSAGNVGIGTDNPQHKLDVAGTIRATEVKVEALPWADFVFDKDYKLLPLDDVKAHIEEHKHLPDIPSEKEVQEQGINIGEMQARLLQKIEELTLYVIQQDEKNKALELEVKELKATLTNK